MRRGEWTWKGALAGAAVLLAGCSPGRTAPPEGNGVCGAPEVQAELPNALSESSGIAASAAYPGIYWTHNDSGGQPVVYALTAKGALVGAVAIRGATNRDWEDVAVAPCGAEPGSCLYIADTGDNSERHDHVVIYRVREPDPRADTVSERAGKLRFRYPDGPRDAEAMFVADSTIFVISKGRSSAIEMYRLAPSFDDRRVEEAERVQQIAPPPTSVSAQVTAAALDPRSRRVAVRTYGSLLFFHLQGDTLAPVGRAADVVAPAQLQGEGVAFIDSQRLILTSESKGPLPALMDVVACDPLSEPPDSTGDGA